MVKTALEPTKKALRRERNTYLIPGIRSSPYIRSQYDILERDPHSGEERPQVDETASAPAGMVGLRVDGIRLVASAVRTVSTKFCPSQSHL